MLTKQQLWLFAKNSKLVPSVCEHLRKGNADSQLPDQSGGLESGVWLECACWLADRGLSRRHGSCFSGCRGKRRGRWCIPVINSTSLWTLLLAPTRCTVPIRSPGTCNHFLRALSSKGCWSSGIQRTMIQPYHEKLYHCIVRSPSDK